MAEQLMEVLLELRVKDQRKRHTYFQHTWRPDQEASPMRFDRRSFICSLMRISTLPDGNATRVTLAFNHDNDSLDDPITYASSLAHTISVGMIKVTPDDVELRSDVLGQDMLAPIEGRFEAPNGLVYDRQLLVPFSAGQLTLLLADGIVYPGSQ